MSKSVILTINAGSSSIKFAIFDINQNNLLLYKGLASNVILQPHIKITSGDEVVIFDKQYLNVGHEACLEFIISWILENIKDIEVTAIGHRVVHGGNDFNETTLIDEKVIKQLEVLVPIAPLHQGHNVAAIKIIHKIFPHIPQAACFDTAFHNTMAAIEKEYALPKYLTEEGIKSYGFHGLSYEYIISNYVKDDKVIIAHLGNGSSLCAVKARKSVATTMGFTPLDGLMMGTRCGDIDPGVLLYLMQHSKMTADEISDLLYNKSGLLGVSGVSHDMSVLLESRNEKAAYAIDMFCYRIVKNIGALTAVLGGVNSLIFTGGIGENSSIVRNKICEKLKWLGILVDDVANIDNNSFINSDESVINVLVIPTDEEKMIAMHTRSMLR